MTCHISMYRNETYIEENRITMRKVLGAMYVYVYIPVTRELKKKKKNTYRGPNIHQHTYQFRLLAWLRGFRLCMFASIYISLVVSCEGMAF